MFNFSPQIPIQNIIMMTNTYNTSRIENILYTGDYNIFCLPNRDARA